MYILNTTYDYITKNIWIKWSLVCTTNIRYNIYNNNINNIIKRDKILYKRRTRRSTGRKPKTDPAVFRYGIKLTSEENGNFELLFEKSGMKQRARFIKAMIFGREMKVVRIDKAAMDYYIRLTNFYHQFQAIGNNYNQTVKAVKSNFGEKRAFALLRNLEKTTIDLVVLSKRVIMLTREFEEEYLIKRKKEEQQNGG